MRPQDRFGTDPEGAVMRLVSTAGDGAFLAEYYDRARELVPGTTEGLSYGMACLRHRGKALVTIAPTSAGYSVYPFSGWVVGEVCERFGWEDRTKGAVHFTAERRLPPELFDALVLVRRDEIEHGRPG